eukprot:scaffold151163_cov33-Tisochrysis_lutea.AAC.2
MPAPFPPCLPLSRRSFVLNSSDRVIRVFSFAKLLEGTGSAGRELQDVVNRVQWSHAAFSSDSEHVIGAVSAAEQKMYVTCALWCTLGGPSNTWEQKGLSSVISPFKTGA